MSDQIIEQKVEENSNVQPQPYQLSEQELQQIQRLKEENKNPYILPLNKKIKALNKKIAKLKKLEQQKLAGKELSVAQAESINNIKAHQKKIANFEKLKTGYLQSWEHQKQNDPSKLFFSLVHAITVDSKEKNEKFAEQFGRLTKLKDLLMQEPRELLEFQTSVDNSCSLLQRFVESSETVAFEEVTFKQLRADLQEITSSNITHIQHVQSELEKKRKQEEKRLKKEQEENERRQRELQLQQENQKKEDNRNRGNNRRDGGNRGGGGNNRRDGGNRGGGNNRRDGGNRGGGGNNRRDGGNRGGGNNRREGGNREGGHRNQDNRTDN